MKLQFHEDATEEFYGAIDYYEERSPGLGDDFYDEIQIALDLIKENPERWSLRRRKTRRFLIGKFPYFIIYIIIGGYILVVAVAHTSRKPSYWKDRLDLTG